VPSFLVTMTTLLDRTPVDDSISCWSSINCRPTCASITGKRLNGCRHIACRTGVSLPVSMRCSRMSVNPKSHTSEKAPRWSTKSLFNRSFAFWGRLSSTSSHRGANAAVKSISENVDVIGTVQQSAAGPASELAYKVTGYKTYAVRRGSRM